MIGIAYLMLILLCFPLQGWILKTLWAWFIVPVFGLPVLTITSALGISLVVCFLTYRPPDADAKQEEGIEAGMKRLWEHGLVVPLWILFLGWIIHAVS